eukprot:763778-Hanusia_phi.AAC.3
MSVIACFPLFLRFREAPRHFSAVDCPLIPALTCVSGFPSSGCQPTGGGGNPARAVSRARRDDPADHKAHQPVPY